MTRVVPHEIDYKTIIKISKVASVLLYSSAIVAIAIFFIDKTVLFSAKELYARNFNALLAIISLLYFLCDVVQNYLFHLAEIKRKNDFIDNSFGTKLSDENSQGFFSNDSFPVGINKLGVNAFENSFFTKAISQRMIMPMIIKSIAILILFLVVIFFTDQSTLTMIVQIALPFTIVQQTARLIFFHYQIKRVFDNFKDIFENTPKAKRPPLIIANVISYEKTLSWGSIQLDGKIFDDNNPRLTTDWDLLKSKYNL